MELNQNKSRLAMIVLLCVLHIGFGLYARQMSLLICGGLGTIYVAVAATKQRYDLAKQASAESAMPVSC